MNGVYLKGKKKALLKIQIVSALHVYLMGVFYYIFLILNFPCSYPKRVNIYSPKFLH